MDYIAVLTFMKRHFLELLLGVVAIYLLGFVIYLLKRDVFGVQRFEKEFKKLFKPIKKKQRKNKEIPSSETQKTLDEIKKLYIMRDKIIISIDASQNFSDKDKIKLLEKLNKTFIKFQKFEKYVQTYHDQICTYYSIENVPLRVAEKLKEYEEIWK